MKNCSINMVLVGIRLCAGLSFFTSLWNVFCVQLKSGKEVFWVLHLFLPRECNMQQNSIKSLFREGFRVKSMQQRCSKRRGKMLHGFMLLNGLIPMQIRNRNGFSYGLEYFVVASFFS